MINNRVCNFEIINKVNCITTNEGFPMCTREGLDFRGFNEGIADKMRESQMFSTLLNIDIKMMSFV